MNASINGRDYTFEPGETILQVARRNGIFIPTLCHFQPLGHKPGTCRVCLAEVTDKNGRTEMLTTCNTPMQEGMRVNTRSSRVRNMQRLQVELIFADHDQDCAACARHGDCELQDLAEYVGLSTNRFAPRINHDRPFDDTMHGMVRDMSKCIRCLRCVEVCRKVQGVAALTVDGTGTGAHIGVGMAPSQNTSACIQCGQCTLVCPTGALAERDENDDVLDYLANPELTTVFAFAPSVRVVIGEEFGMTPGENVEGRIVAALRRLGADIVIDTDFAADLTIMEEGTELLQRLNKYLAGDRTVKIPLMTSCCPGWVSFMEKHFPELGENLSTAKSPQQMFGAIAKNYLAPKLGIDRRNFIVVSVMPCVAKKSEAARPEFGKDGDPDVNISITTRELAHMIRFANMNFDELEESDFDRPLGESTGAGVIFGTTGGVIEAAVRTAYEIQTKKTLPKLDFTELRGLAGIRSATIDFDGVPVKIGIAHGLGNARRLVEEIRAGRSPYHAIEIMACPGGCINGGGQPYHRGNEELLKRRAEALYAEDAAKPLRKSHENPDIQALYEEFLGEPCGPLSHELLHTRYYDRKPVVEPKK